VIDSAWSFLMHVVKLKNMAENHDDLQFRKLDVEDLDLLMSYLQGLSIATKSRFRPHAYDKQSLAALLAEDERSTGYIALEKGEIIAYAVIQKGWLAHDAPRLRSYGLKENPSGDYVFAPSVADGWQGRGLGSQFFRFILAEPAAQQYKRIILWGGVQAGNAAALRFYRKHGFIQLGVFEYYGTNIDMLLVVK
jgi:diamine N-acetyltransferase